MGDGSQIEDSSSSKQPLRVLLLGEGRHNVNGAAAVPVAANGAEELSSSALSPIGAGLLRVLEHAAVVDAGSDLGPPFEVVDASSAKTGDRAVCDLLTGARSADSVLLAVPAERSMLQWDIREGGRVREHMLLAAALGFRRLVVCVDGLSDPSPMCAEQRFREVRSQLWDLLEQASFQPSDVTFLPTVNLAGDESEELLPEWYAGPSFLAALCSSRANADLSGKPLRVPVQDVYLVRGEERVAVGRVEMGTLKEGMQLSISPGDLPVQVRRVEHGNLESADAPLCDVRPGELVRFVGLAVAREPGSTRPEDAEQLTAGAVLSEASRDPAQACQSFLAEFVVLRDPPRGAIRAGYQPTLDVHTAHIRCVLKELRWRRPRQGPQRLDVAPIALREGDVAEAWIEPLQPVALEVFSFCPPLGRFALCDGEITVAAGVVKDAHGTLQRVACFDD